MRIHLIHVQAFAVTWQKKNIFYSYNDRKDSAPACIRTTQWHHHANTNQPIQFISKQKQFQTYLLLYLSSRPPPYIPFYTMDNFTCLPFFSSTHSFPKYIFVQSVCILFFPLLRSTLLFPCPCGKYPLFPTLFAKGMGTGQSHACIE